MPNGQTVSSLYSYNVSSGVRTQIGGATAYNINSLIYSMAANSILWGTIGNSDIVRIGLGSGTVVFYIPNLPTSTFNVGVGLPNAYMLI